MEEQTCKDCRFRVEREKIYYRYESSQAVNIIECHRRSPVTDCTWPRIKDEEWCGEFEFKEEKLEDVPTEDVSWVGRWYG